MRDHGSYPSGQTWLLQSGLRGPLVGYGVSQYTTALFDDRATIPGSIAVNKYIHSIHYKLKRSSIRRKTSKCLYQPIFKCQTEHYSLGITFISQCESPRVSVYGYLSLCQYLLRMCSTTLELVRPTPNQPREWTTNIRGPPICQNQEGAYSWVRGQPYQAPRNM